MQFGVYDLSGTPSQIDLGRVAFRDLYLPTIPAAQRKVADIGERVVDKVDDLKVAARRMAS